MPDGETEEVDMSLHVNGWNIIARYLERASMRQGDLAQVLHISKAAVSQIKNGQFLLNPRQLATIADYLKFDDAAISEFYTTLFNARLAGAEPEEGPALPEAVGHRTFRVNLTEGGAGTPAEPEAAPAPVAGFSLLRSFEPAFEPLTKFLRRNSPERSREHFPQEDMCVIRIEPGSNSTELAPGSLLMIEADTYPAAGDLTLFGVADGRILLREYHPEGDRVVFRPVLAGGGRELYWSRAEEPGLIRWIHPVHEIVLKMHR